MRIAILATAALLVTTMAGCIEQLEEFSQDAVELGSKVVNDVASATGFNTQEEGGKIKSVEVLSDSHEPGDVVQIKIEFESDAPIVKWWMTIVHTHTRAENSRAPECNSRAYASNYTGFPHKLYPDYHSKNTTTEEAYRKDSEMMGCPLPGERINDTIVLGAIIPKDAANGEWYVRFHLWSEREFYKDESKPEGFQYTGYQETYLKQEKVTTFEVTGGRDDFKEPIITGARILDETVESGESFRLEIDMKEESDVSWLWIKFEGGSINVELLDVGSTTDGKLIVEIPTQYQDRYDNVHATGPGTYELWHIHSKDEWGQQGWWFIEEEHPTITVVAQA